MITFNTPETVAALTEASDRYEHALATNDITALDALFHDGPHVVRYGVTECLYGGAEIAAFRRARTGGAPPRTNLRREITTLTPDIGCVNIEFERQSDGRRGRQSQTWMQDEHGWRVISAHVSLLPA